MSKLTYSRCLNLSIAGKLDSQLFLYRKLIHRINKFEYQKNNFATGTAIEKLNAELLNMSSFYRRITEWGNRGMYNKTNIEQSDIKTIFQTIRKLPKLEDHYKIVTGQEYIRKPYKPTDFERLYLKKMETYKKKARKSIIIWKLNMEIKEKIAAGWFLVFNTLTVATENYQKVFSPGSKSFSQYIRDLDKQVNGKDNHEYFAVTEIGKLGREHLHVMHMFKQIPGHWSSDPNKGLQQPIRREVQSLKSSWSHGHSNPIAVRVDASDAWSRIHWRWPVKKTKSGYQPLDSSCSERLALYLGKYISKTLNHNGGKTCPIKKRQKLGIKLLMEIMKKLTIKQLLITTQIPKSKTLKMNQRPIPKVLMKTEAMREMIQRLRKKEESFKILMELEAHPSIIKHLKISTQETLDHNLQSITPTRMMNIDNTDISEIQKIIDDIYNSKNLTKADHQGLAGTSMERN